MAHRYDQYSQYTLDQLLEALDGDALAGSDTYQYLENIIHVRTAMHVHDALDHNAKTTSLSGNKIAAKIDGMTAALEQSSKDLQAASAQSATTAKRLNSFTLVLAGATILMAVAAGWQGWETKRQADAAEQALKRPPSILVSPPTANNPSLKK